MRTTILLCTLLILAGCSTAPQPEAQKAPPPGKVHVLQTDSPIIITDGSIDFTKEYGIDFKHNKYIRAQIDPNQPVALRVYGCTGVTLPSGCTGHKIRLGSGTAADKWVVELHHTDGSVVTTLTYAYSPSGYVDITIPATNSTGTFSQDASSGGRHVVQSGHQLGSATVNGQTLGCPPPPSGTEPS
jgi:hypothetical protein